MGIEQPCWPSPATVAPQGPQSPGTSLVGDARQWLLGQVGALWALFTGRPVSLYATSVLRIGYGLLYLVFLVREFPHRGEIWGPDSPWTPALAKQLFEQTGWNSVLTLSDNPAYFEFCYAMAVATSVLFVLGWRTRVMSVLFAVVVISFHARSIFMTDGGDNLVLLMAVYLVLTACGRRWSLDARRDRLKSARADTAPEPVRGLYAQELRHARVTLTTVVHNCGVFVIAAQICFLYGSAGLYKVQGSTWGGGTALHYALNLELFQPWPVLSHLVAEFPMVIAITGYITVLVQVAFPFVLFGRLKYPVLAVLLGMHIGIAVLMGLPLFSGAMIIADAAFLPDRFYTFLPQLWRRAAQRTGMRQAAPGRATGSGSVPAQGRPELPAPQNQVVPGGGRSGSAHPMGPVTDHPEAERHERPRAGSS